MAYTGRAKRRAPFIKALAVEEIRIMITRIIIAFLLVSANAFAEDNECSNIETVDLENNKDDFRSDVVSSVRSVSGP